MDGWTDGMGWDGHEGEIAGVCVWRCGSHEGFYGDSQHGEGKAREHRRYMMGACTFGGSQVHI